MSSREMTERPNILLILTDQHRLSAISAYGDTPCETPHLQRLADEGITFETAYACCPVCSPVRASIMTGLWPHAHGVCSNVHNLGNSVHELGDNPSTLSRQLLSAGYRCGYTGKWHLGDNRRTAFGAPVEPSMPFTHGFEGQNFPGHGGGGHGYKEYRDYLAANGFEHTLKPTSHGPHAMPYAVESNSEEATVPYFLAEHSIELMNRYAAAEDPFFIWHNFWGPHAPYYAPQEFFDIYKNMEIPEWPNYRWDGAKSNLPLQVKIHPHADDFTWDDWAEAIKHYYAFTTLIDKQIGRMLDNLEATGLADNTIVIFTADHGETIGSHGGLTDKGWHHFEEIQRIPFIVRLPKSMKGVATGTVMKEWVSNLDLFPSILDLASIDFDREKVHGLSVKPLLEGRETSWRDSVFVEFHGVNNLSTSMLTCRHGDIKYGWNCSSFDELYNLGTDPHETSNLIDDPDYAGTLSEMRNRALKFMQETQHGCAGIYRQSRLKNCRW